MDKTERFVQLKKLASSVISYWSILSLSMEEKLEFMPLLHCAKAESIDEMPELPEGFMETVENECNRLEKSMADLILRKKSKLDQIYQKSHLEPPLTQEPSDAYMAFELVKERISIAKAASMKRQDIVTRFEILQTACDEIEWYVSPSFDASSIEDHQRVARGKVLVDFFPKVMEDLEDKVTAWNLKESDIFSFDGVDVRQRIEAVKTSYNDHMARVPGGIDIHQLVVPRQPRTVRVPVVNVPPQPQPPVSPPQLSDDHSMASSESISSKDSDYRPSGSEASE